jgi:hypothetical protein
MQLGKQIRGSEGTRFFPELKLFVAISCNINARLLEAFSAPRHTFERMQDLDQ